MPRDFRLYLEDILNCIENINGYVSGLTFESFSEDKKTLDAVIRNLEIIGEASRNVPDEIRNEHPEIKWRGIIGLRNVLIHMYYSLTLKIIWDIVKNELPILDEQITQLLAKK